MDLPKPILIALQFDDRINKRDLHGLADLMTEDHIFIDNDGRITTGKDALTKGWRGFFEAYPDYRTVITSVTVQNDRVVMIGNSTCSDKKLEGPNVWTAKTRDGQISEWRVNWLDRR